MSRSDPGNVGSAGVRSDPATHRGSRPGSRRPRDLSRPAATPTVPSPGLPRPAAPMRQDTLGFLD